MIEGRHKVLQAFLGTLMTWGLTAAGSALVFVFSSGRFSGKRKILDASLGFAAGVMTAASFWSLLAPAIEMAGESGVYGEKFVWLPCAIGFALGGAFVLLSDMCLPCLGDPAFAQSLQGHATGVPKKHDGQTVDTCTEFVSENEKSANVDTISVQIFPNSHAGSGKAVQVIGSPSESSGPVITGDRASVRDSVELSVKKRKKKDGPSKVVLEYQIASDSDKQQKELQEKVEKWKSWKRLLLLVIAITVHNIPEGLAVGVAFGAVGESASATFASARNLAFGIGIQNFPEGMAVSIPLAAAGYSPLKSFWYGQLSGMVEPLSGVLGAVAVTIATPLLPYALSFAAGAMIYVVASELIPEAHMCGNGRIASWGCMVGFIVMMCLDVGLG